MHCYYHEDIDGTAAAFIVHKIYTKYAVEEDIEHDYTKSSYNTEFNNHKDDEDIIFVVDLSFTADTIDKLFELCKYADKVIWVDHHQSTQDLLQNKEFLIKLRNKYTNLYIYFSQDGCGAMNVYNLYKNKEYSEIFEKAVNQQSYKNDIVYLENINKDIYIPLWLSYVDDYDRWIKRKKHTDEFIRGLECAGYELTVYNPEKKVTTINRIWDRLSSYFYVDSIIKDGKVITTYNNNEYKSELANTFTFNVYKPSGEKFGTILCKNTAKRGSTQFGDMISKYDAVSIFYFDGKVWHHSIYSDKNSSFNCAEFSEKYGGGGHIHAAGFRRSKEQGPLWIRESSVKPNRLSNVKFATINTKTPDDFTPNTSITSITI